MPGRHACGAPPPQISPGLGRMDAVRASRAWQALGAPHRLGSPASDPASTRTVSSNERHGGVPGGPPPPPVPVATSAACPSAAHLTRGQSGGVPAG
eukprot:6890600-Alexandrium_andersonii.AAC.1